MGAMKVTIDSVRGVVTEDYSNGLFIEEIALFSQPVALSSQVVTTTAVTVNKPCTLVATVDDCVLTLPNASVADQQEFKIKKINTSAYSLTINAVSGQTIDGQTSLLITAQYTTVVLYAAGGNWYIM